MSKTIVIGAGIAGIMAARTLRDAGHVVTVLEARSRIGGRTHTNHDLSNPVDLGASWIHGSEGNLLTRIARRLNMRFAPTDFLNRSITAVRAYDENGTPLDQTKYAEGLQSGLGALYNYSGSILYERPKGATSFKDVYKYGLPKPKFRLRATQLGYKYQTLISTEYVSSTDWDKLDWSLNGSYIKLPGPDQLLYEDGFNTITDHLAEGLDIVRTATVEKVIQEADRIAVVTKNYTFYCDQVVIAVPLGVLKANKIQFEPPLPEEKQGAIARIGYGDYEKLVMEFDKFYWPKTAQRFNYLSKGEPSLFNAWLNIGHYTNRPVIVAYHAGRRARKINTWDDDTFITEAVAVMQKLFGDNGYGEIPRPKNYVRTDWQNDPYSLGSYSFNQVGQQAGDRETLAKNIDNKLYFAGEATHPHMYATVHGAYETGVKVGRKIIANSPEPEGSIRYTTLKHEHSARAAALLALCFPTMLPDGVYHQDDLEYIAETFPEGTIVALDGDKVVGLGIGVFVDLDFDNMPDTETEVTYPNQKTYHDPDGQYYYGADFCVHPNYRRRGIGSQIYIRRKAVVTANNRKGFAAAAVLPGYAEHKATMDAHTYVDKVIAGELFDSTLSMQLKNGFRVKKVIHDFYDYEKSDNWSALILWNNEGYVAA